MNLTICVLSSRGPKDMNARLSLIWVYIETYDKMIKIELLCSYNTDIYSCWQPLGEHKNAIKRFVERKFVFCLCKFANSQQKKLFFTAALNSKSFLLMSWVMSMYIFQCCLSSRDGRKETIFCFRAINAQSRPF